MPLTYSPPPPPPSLACLFLSHAQDTDGDKFCESIGPFLKGTKSSMLLIKDKVDQLTDDYDELVAAYEETTDELP